MSNEKVFQLKISPDFLFTLCQRGNYDAFVAFYQHFKAEGINPLADDFVDAEGNSLFEVACLSSSEDSTKMVAFLCDEGADVNKKRLGYSPLHRVLLATTYSLATVHLLCAKGADVNTKDNEGRGILGESEVGLMYCNVDVLRCLVEHGFNISEEKLIAARQKGGETATDFYLHFLLAVCALRRGKLDEIRIYLKIAGTVATLLAEHSLNICSLFLHADQPAYKLDDTQRDQLRKLLTASPLHYAVKTGDVTLVRRFCDTGADLDARDSLGSTPLHWAMSCENAEQRGQIVRTLCEHGADVNAVSNKGERIECAGDVEIMRCLVEYRYNIDEELLQREIQIHSRSNKTRSLVLYLQFLFAILSLRRNVLWMPKSVLVEMSEDSQEFSKNLSLMFLHPLQPAYQLNAQQRNVLLKLLNNIVEETLRENLPKKEEAMVRTLCELNNALQAVYFKRSGVATADERKSLLYMWAWCLNKLWELSKTKKTERETENVDFDLTWTLCFLNMITLEYPHMNPKGGNIDALIQHYPKEFARVSGQLLGYFDECQITGLNRVTVWRMQALELCAQQAETLAAENVRLRDENSALKAENARLKVQPESNPRLAFRKSKSLPLFKPSKPAEPKPVVLLQGSAMSYT